MWRFQISKMLTDGQNSFFRIFRGSPKNKGRMGPKAGWLLGGKQGCFCLLLKKARYRASKRFLKPGMERYCLAGGKALVGILEVLERLLSNDAVRGEKEGAILIPFSGKILPPFATESQHFSPAGGYFKVRENKQTNIVCLFSLFKDLRHRKCLKKQGWQN